MAKDRKRKSKAGAEEGPAESMALSAEEPVLNGVLATPKRTERSHNVTNGLPNGHSTRKTVLESATKGGKTPANGRRKEGGKGDGEDEEMHAHGPRGRQTGQKQTGKQKELTLGEKLAKQTREKGGKAAAAKLAMGEGSMASLLVQGLLAQDDEKLDAVLREERPDVIFKTVHDLQPTHVIHILKVLEQRLRTRSATNITPWLKWIRSIFNVHMSYLTSVSTVESEMASLLDWLKSRVAHQTRIFEINEKLNVILDQIERRNKKTVDSLQPLVIFGNEDEDGSSDDLESFASEGSGEGSEDEWWHDGEGRDEDFEDDDNSDEQQDSDSDEDMEAVLRKRRRMDADGNESESGDEEESGGEGEGIEEDDEDAPMELGESEGDSDE